MHYRLSDCFPATTPIITKLIKKEIRIPPIAIQRHDKAVRKNWQKLLNGELEISGEYMQHLVINPVLGKLSENKRIFTLETRIK